MDTLEPEKHWNQAQCLGVAQALMDLIPADWNPEPGEGEGVQGLCPLDHEALVRELQEKQLPGNCPECGKVLVAHLVV